MTALLSSGKDASGQGRGNNREMSAQEQVMPGIDNAPKFRRDICRHMPCMHGTAHMGVQTSGEAKRR
jgi:hypothetical protein